MRSVWHPCCMLTVACAEQIRRICFLEDAYIFPKGVLTFLLRGGLGCTSKYPPQQHGDCAWQLFSCVGEGVARLTTVMRWGGERKLNHKQS